MPESPPFPPLAVFTRGSREARGRLLRTGYGDHAAGGARRNKDDRSGQHPLLLHHWPPVAPAAAPKSRHFCIAALRMLIPPSVAEDGIRLVSTRGASGAGSGKSFTPFSRMHWANSRAAACCWGLLLSPVNPGGSRSLHTLMACSNAAVLVSSDEPFATASIVNSPDAFGSGNALTPLARMHSANFTALSRAVAFL